jgi:hypothetical protein
MAFWLAGSVARLRLPVSKAGGSATLQYIITDRSFRTNADQAIQLRLGSLTVSPKRPRSEQHLCDKDI